MTFDNSIFLHIVNILKLFLQKSIEESLHAKVNISILNSFYRIWKNVYRL